MDSSDLSDGPITLQEYLEVKKALASSEAKVQQLMKVNNNLSEELRRLQKEVGTVTSPGLEVWERKQVISKTFVLHLIIVESNRRFRKQNRKEMWEYKTRWGMVTTWLGCVKAKVAKTAW